MKRMKDLQTLLMDLCGSFIDVSIEKVDVVIVQALEKIGRFVDADRVCIFLYATDHSECINTHEWCYEGIQPHKNKLKHLPLPVIAPLREAHEEGELYYVEEVDLLPETPLKAFLLNRQAQSMVAVPMMEKDTCLGFISVDAVRHKRQLTEEETILLTGFAQTMVKLMVQHRTEQQVQALSSEMEEKTSLLQHITDNMFDLVALTDPQGNFTYLGKSHEILGYELEYLKGKNVMDFVHPSEHPAVMEAFQSFLINQESGRRVEYRIRCRDGSYLWLETMGKILTDDTGKTKEILFSSRDITRQKQEKEKLKQVVKASQLFLDTSEKVDYHYLAEEIRRLTGAAYAACNLFDEEGGGFTTKALAGTSSHIEKAARLLGFQIVGKEWPYDPDREEKTRHKTITTFDSMEILTNKTIPTGLIRLVEKTFDIGQAVIVKITKQDKVLGDFTLLMPQGKTLAHSELAALFASQVGLMLDREEHQRRLELSDKTYREIFNSTIDALFIHDIETGKILDVNDTMLKMFGYERKELPNINVSILSDSEDPFIEEKAKKLIKQCADGEDINFRWVCRRKNGEHFHAENYLHRVTIAGQPRIMATVRDITDRVEQEEELRLQNGLINSLLHSIPDLVFYKDLDGVHLGGNTAYADYLGISLDEIPGKTDYDLHTKKEADLYRYHDKQMLKQQSPRYNEEWITYPDGRKALLDTQKAPLMDSNNNVRGILGIGRDITDRKKAEEKLQDFAAQLEKKNMELDMALYQAEAANEAKSQFLATMNHEIRTPLNGMLGFLQLLEQTSLSDMQSEYMNYMNYSAQHLLSLVNNVLDMAKIEAGEMQLDKYPFDLKEEIDTALATLYPLAREKGLQLNVEKDPCLPNWLEGDPRRLRQIIINLVGNALKFTEAGSVSLTIESLGSKEGFHDLHLEVSDTGPGMDQDSQDMLFQPFFQIRDNHNPHPGGTGLGLSITRELVELMGGRIQVHSVLGTGSTFTVRLNLKEVSHTSY